MVKNATLNLFLVCGNFVIKTTGGSFVSQPAEEAQVVINKTGNS